MEINKLWERQNHLKITSMQRRVRLTRFFHVEEVVNFLRNKSLGDHQGKHKLSFNERQRVQRFKLLAVNYLTCLNSSRGKRIVSCVP